MILGDFILQIFADSFPCLEYIYFLSWGSCHLLVLRGFIHASSLLEASFECMWDTYLSKHIVCSEEKFGSIAKEERQM